MKTITSNTPDFPGSNVFAWNVPRVPENEQYYIVLKKSYTDELFFSDHFTISLPRIIMIKPPLDIYRAGETMTIEWSTKGIIKNVDILIIDQNGQEQTIISATPNDGEYVWDVPWWFIQGNYFIRIMDSSDYSIYADSSSFAIQISVIGIFIIIGIIGLTSLSILLSVYMVKRNRKRVKLKKIKEIITVEKSPDIHIIKLKFGEQLKFSPDGQFLIGSGNKYLKVMDYNEMKIIGSFKIKGSKFIVSPDSKRIITEKGKVISLDSLQKKKVVHLKGFSSTSSMIFNPDGEIIINSHKHKKGISMRDALNGTIVKSFPLQFPISNITISHDGKKLIGFHGIYAHILDFQKEILLQTLKLDMYPRAYVLTPDGNRLFFGGYTKDIKEWNITTGELIHKYEGHNGIITSLALSPDNRYLLSGSSDKSIKMWDIKSKSLITTLYDVEENPIVSLAIHPRGNDLVSTSTSKHLTVWNFDNFINSKRDY